MGNMINFLSMTRERALDSKFVTEAEYDTYCGLFTSPKAGFDVSNAKRWAADNGCFLRYEPDKFRAMLERYQAYTSTCKFIVCPDRVQNAVKTIQLFHMWYHSIKAYGYPVAFVLQDGITMDTVPWRLADAIFVGGSNQFKDSLICRQIVKKAIRLGMCVHNGRISSPPKIVENNRLGVTSFDSTAYNLHRPGDIRKHIAYVKPENYKPFIFPESHNFEVQDYRYKPRKYAKKKVKTTSDRQMLLL